MLLEITMTEEFFANATANAKNGTAVATAERSAARVLFQRMQMSIPPVQNDNSADTSPTAACHFGG